MYNKIFYLFFIFIHCNAFDFYHLSKMKRLHYNEPIIFKNYNTKESIIKLSKQYGIKDDKQNQQQLKQDIYKIFMKNKKIIYINIDNTICTTKLNDYIHSIPDYNIIHKMNKLYEEGNEIHYWSSRGTNSGIDWGDTTLKQMKLWGVMYNTINIGKPCYDFWIDNKSYNIDMI